MLTFEAEGQQLAIMPQGQLLPLPRQSPVGVIQLALHGRGDDLCYVKAAAGYPPSSAREYPLAAKHLHLASLDLALL